MIVAAASLGTVTATTGATRSDEARARRQADRLQTARQALATLKTAARPNDGLKARAREKLEALRNQLQQLRLVGATARQIAALAKELKEAVNAYGRAGGSTAEFAASPADDAKPAEATAAPADPAPGDAPSEAHGDEAPAASGAEADKTANAAEGPTPGRPVENPYEKANAAHAESVATAARKSDEAQQDRDFINKARRLAEALKRGAAEATHKAQQTAKPADRAAAAQAADSAENADRAIGDLQQSFGGGPFLSQGSVSA